MLGYFAAALTLGLMALVAWWPFRQRGVPPADIEVCEELVRQGIAADPQAITRIQADRERELVEVLRMRHLWLQRAETINADVLAQATIQTTTRHTIAAQQRRQAMVYLLLNDPAPSPSAIHLASQAIERARSPRTPL